MLGDILSSMLVGKLRTYCLAKPGATEAFDMIDEGINPIDETKPAYCLEGAFWLRFAQFSLADTPEHLLLRLEPGLSRSIQITYPASITMAKEAEGGMSTWRRVEISLNGSIPETELLSLIDRSYDFAISELSNHEKGLAALTERHPPAQEALEILIGLHYLSHRYTQIKSMVRPGIVLPARATDETALPLGQSKVGGLPDLPEEWAWPTFDGKSLVFLAQLNLAEIPQNIDKTPLPETGILYFFSAFGWQQEDDDVYRDLCLERWTEAGFSQVLFFAGDLSSLRRRSTPDNTRTFSAAVVEYCPILSTPIAHWYGRDPIVSALEWSEEEYNRLVDLYSDFDEMYNGALKLPARHQLLGYVHPIQNEVTNTNTRLLFQLGSDYDNTGMMWEDGGTIYFIVPQTDLERQVFSLVTSELQCY